MRCVPPSLLEDTMVGLEEALNRTKFRIKWWISETEAEDCDQDKDEGLLDFLSSFTSKMEEVLHLIPEVKRRLQHQEEDDECGWNWDEDNFSGSEAGGDNDNYEDYQDDDDGRNTIIVKRERDIDPWTPENEEDEENMEPEGGAATADPLGEIRAEGKGLNNNYPISQCVNFVLPMVQERLPPARPPPPKPISSTTTLRKGVKKNTNGGIILPSLPPLQPLPPLPPLPSLPPPPRHNHPCNKCGQLFTSKRGLRQHTRRRHEPEFICTLCPGRGLRFTFPHTLEKHVQQVHEEGGGGFGTMNYS